MADTTDTTVTVEQKTIDFGKVETAANPKITTESWFKTRWRPAMAWLYMALIIYDFIAMPIIWPIALFLLKVPFVAWSPLTLQSGGLVHVCFGAVLGLYTYGRTKEVLNGATSEEK